MKIPILRKYVEQKESYIERRLPAKGKIFVKKGDKINSFDQIGEASFIRDKERLEYVGEPVKDVGDRVYPGDVIALEKKFLVKKLETVVNISGRIKDIDATKKVISIEGLSTRYNLISGVSGEVVDTLNDESVLIKSSSLVMKCAAGCGSEIGGELVYIKGEGEVVVEKDISAKVAGKIILVNKIDRSASKKAKILGALGFIIGSCDYATYKKYIEEDLSVVILEGFGNIDIASDLLAYLSKLSSKFCILRTYESMFLLPGEINTGLIKRDIIEEFETELQVGDLLQIFDTDYYGKSGKVIEIHEDKGILVVSIDGKEVEIQADKVGLLV
ncbi:hypothetical protein COV24_02550 [candidate division WWE3 bacterium CG10_big_fil_rev_8_21_14_0_10_32_10]|uniref:KOW domain-containing protein n=1 Tax=candidate division WWE3 bacterium CG10_big_fil_rev_8_21_14_0_10_32_10 TaxID=1975090 RepID=A0A2H0RAA7_UNCKA|nr:MAG: hypothetical protein COV24_02550 [candidate division WWE3 bacterium CG10_big_fil_rev_8_21_14_0_10_32_10]